MGLLSPPFPLLITCVNPLIICHFVGQIKMIIRKQINTGKPQMRVSVISDITHLLDSFVFTPSSVILANEKALEDDFRCSFVLYCI